MGGWAVLVGALRLSRSPGRFTAAWHDTRGRESCGGEGDKRKAPAAPAHLPLSLRVGSNLRPIMHLLRQRIKPEDGAAWCRCRKGFWITRQVEQHFEVFN